MIERVMIEKRRGSFWIYNWKNPRYKDRMFCTSYPLYKSICNIFNPKWKIYQSNLDLYDKNNKILKLPVGYGLDKIKELLNQSNKTIEMKIVDKSDYYVKYKETKVELKDNYIPRDEIQKKAIQFLTSCMEKENDINQPSFQLFLSLLTGGGKTFCAIYSAVKLKLPTMIISYNLSDQWREKLLEYVDISNDDIYEIRGRDSVTELLQMNKTFPFYIASISTIRNIMNYYQDLNLLLEKLEIGLMIFDEAHLHYKAIMNILVNSDVRFTFFLSATPNRSNYTDNRVFLNLFNKIPSHGRYTENFNNHSKVRYVKYNTNPTLQDRKLCKTLRGFSAVNYYKYLYASDEKVLLMIGMIKYFADQILNIYPEYRILVFIPTLEFMDYVYKFLSKYDLKYTIGQYNSNVSSLEKKEKELEKNLILTTIAACSVGKDIPNLKAIFSLTPFSSPVITRQILGRLRKLENSDTFFYDFVDVGFADCIRQYKQRNTLLRELSSKIDEKIIDPEKMILYLKES